MSVEQYQRTVNTLDKEIADLEKKRNAFSHQAFNLPPQEPSPHRWSLLMLPIGFLFATQTLLKTRL